MNFASMKQEQQEIKLSLFKFQNSFKTGQLKLHKKFENQLANMEKVSDKSVSKLLLQFQNHSLFQPETINFVPTETETIPMITDGKLDWPATSVSPPDSEKLPCCL